MTWVSIFQGAETSSGDIASLPANDLLDMIADLESLHCPDEAAKKAGEGFILAKYRPEANTKAMSALAEDSATDVLCFDIDDMAPEEIAEAIPTWSEYNTAIYSTRKHAPESPRYRLLVEVAQPIPQQDRTVFAQHYAGAAQALKIKFDPNACDMVRLFFGPQHDKNPPESYRFEGKPLPVRPVAVAKATKAKTFESVGYRPTKTEVKKLVASLRKGGEKSQQMAAVLAAVLRGESFAEEGHRHGASRDLSFFLVREFRTLDSEWFGETYMRPVFELWGTYPDAVTKWTGLCETAKDKLRKENEEREIFTGEELQAAEELRGRWVLSHRASYYVYSVRECIYKGPFAAVEVPIVVRDELAGLPGVSEVEYTKSGEILKSAQKLCHEYGTTIDTVEFYAKHPGRAWNPDSGGVCLQAYQWIDWEPVFHPIADELLRAIGGKHYELLEAYLTQFRNLDQPLPALTVVGPRGVWKSQICQILSRFWKSKDCQTAGDAGKIMARFNGHLLENPIVWSDEALAVTAYGKPQPEAYRASITSTSQTIEIKGVNALINLKSAVRHMISVNDDSKVFSSEVDADSIHATMERFLLMYPTAEDVGRVEDRWRGSAEMDRLREGSSLLEHVAWLEQHRADRHTSTGRLYVTPHSEAQTLLRARFSDDTLVYIMQVAIEALKKEQGTSVSDPKRMPMYMQKDGVVRMQPGRVTDLWSVSTCTQGCGIKKPTAQKVGQILTKAGFKAHDAGHGAGWHVDMMTLEGFMDVSETVTYREVLDMLKDTQKTQ